jgi:hypothetical protein
MLNDLRLVVLLTVLLAVPTLAQERAHATVRDAQRLSGRSQKCDSVCIVRIAARAFGPHIPLREWQVDGFQRTDSGTVVTIVMKSVAPRQVVVGGGGTVLVRKSGKTRILKRYR